MIRAFDFDVPFRAALVVFIFIGFGTALPNLPAMVGPYQYACQLALEMFGVSKADGLAYGLVLNAVQFLDHHRARRDRPALRWRQLVRPPPRP